MVGVNTAEAHVLYATVGPLIVGRQFEKWGRLLIRPGYESLDNQIKRYPVRVRKRLLR
jgi:hypothetical protein